MTRTTGRLGLLALCALPLIAYAGDGASLPVYRFKPGQELTFHSSSQFKYGEGKTAGEHGTTSDYTVWVVCANPDGSFRLVIRDKNQFSQTVQDKKMDQPARTTMLYADVFPDGRVLTNKSIRYQGHPGSIFPQLPHDAAQAKAGWASNRNEDKVICKPMEAAGNFTFEAVTDSPFNKIYLSSSKSKYTFDAAKGFVTKDESENTQGYGFKGKGAGTMELKSIKMMEPAALEKLAKSADKFFAAVASYEEKTEAAQKCFPAPEKAKDLLAKAAEDLKNAAAGLENEELKTELAQMLEQHKNMEKYYLDGAEKRAKMVGKPAAEFEVASMDGKTVKLANLRGQVVVLDFWYRGCGWCIKAMPQMNQLAADFADKPVAIFGMNTDRVEEDAKFVIEKMALKYPTLKAEGLPQRFSVQGFPTLIVIDQQGKVHDIHVGYSPNLREEVGKQIRELLAKN